jgi:chemotaxis signal transduction protein
LLLDFTPLEASSIEAPVHRTAEPGALHSRPVVFSVPCAGDPELPTVCVSGRQVLEILHYLPPASIPAAPGRLMGLMQWQERMLPVIDLAAALGYAPTDRARVKRTIILRCSTRSDVLAVPASDQVATARNLTGFRQVPVPLEATARAIRGVFLSDNGEALVVPDLDALV